MATRLRFLPTETKTATFTTRAYDISEFNDLNVAVTTANVTGTTPSMVVTVEDSIDKVNWRTVDTFTAITAAGHVERALDADADLTKWARCVGTITGTTPSFDVTIEGWAE